MTTAHLNAPAGVDGLEPDAGGASNAPVAHTPVSTTLPRGHGRSRWSGAWTIPATVVAAGIVGTVIRGWVW